MALILASASPRRKELLGYITKDFTVRVSDADETTDPCMDAKDTVLHLAKIKGEAVHKDYPEDTVISADTVVVLGNNILGKPHSEEEAFSMLRSLSGRTHEVYTGVYIITPDETSCFYEETQVKFCELSDDDIRKYIATGEPFDKAGAYGIQGKGCTLISSISGDYYNVMGLPAAKLNRILKDKHII